MQLKTSTKEVIEFNAQTMTKVKNTAAIHWN